MSAEAKNLEAIQSAIVQHNGNCGSPVLEIRMCPFEVERLGWEEFRGIPIVADDKVGTGRFRLVCEVDHSEPTTRERVEATDRESAIAWKGGTFVPCGPVVTPPVPATA